MAELQATTEKSTPTPYVGLEGQHAGYDQPSDPPSYTDVTKTSANIPQTQTAYPGPPTHPAQPAYPGLAPAVNVTQQPVSVNNVVVSSPTTIVVEHISYLGFSIFTCLCCFWPLGLVAIIFSCISRDDAMYGRLQQARNNARVALWLNVISVLLGIVCISVLVIVQITGANEAEDDYGYKK